MTLLPKDRQCSFYRRDRADQVDVDRLAHLGQLAPACGREGTHAGIRHDDVEPAELGGGPLHGWQDRIRVRDVERDRHDLGGPGGEQSRRQCFEAIEPASRDRQAVTPAREFEREALPDPEDAP